MKIDTVKLKIFEPILITIKLETIEELTNAKLLFNMSSQLADIFANNHHVSKHTKANDFALEIFEGLYNSLRS